MTPDILVYIRNGENEELRYALRSWCQNLNFNNLIVVSGSKPPKWLQPDILIKNRSQLGKVRQAYENVRLGLEDPRTAKNVIIMMDDVFVLKPIGDWKPNFNYNRGTLTQQWGVGSAKHGEDAYTCQVRMTYEALKRHFETPLSFEEHAPFWCEKDKMLKLFDIYGDQLYKYLFRSLYGNIYQINTEYKPDFKALTCETKIPAEEPFASSNDTTFRLGNVGSMVKYQFPNKCRYEI